MASVELPAQQVLSELTARGVNDVVVAVVASPQSTVIGGATQTVRDLVAAWEQRDVMAREVAVDVASHSPQVDPILDELADVLAELNPMTPDVPYYSATLFDPREQPACDAGYWVDNLRHTVRFAAAVQAALEDGYRVFAELAPHPLLTHAVEQTARSLDMPLAALAGMRREQELPHGLRGFVADLHSAGAAVDFSVLYPSGRLVDAPLPTWTHRQLLLSRDGQESPDARRMHRFRASAAGARMCACRRSRSATSGRPRSAPPPSPGWATTRSTTWLCFRGRLTARWRWPRPARCSARRAEVRDIRFEQMLLLDEQTPIGAVGVGVIAGRRRLRGGDQSGRRTSAARHRGPARRRGRAAALRTTCPRCSPRIRDPRMAPRCASAFGPAWRSVRSGVHRSGRRAHRRGDSRHRAGRGRATRARSVRSRMPTGASGAAGCLFPVR